MGLDNYMQRTAKSPEEISFPFDLHLCRGMFSGHGSTGSFRGKVYTEFFSENVDVSLYSDMEPEQVAQVAQRLAALVQEHPNQAWDDEVGWFPDGIREECYYTVRAQEVRDLSALFQAAAEQYCEMIASY